MAITEEESRANGGSRRGGDLFIVDNSDGDWKVRDYLREWTDISHRFDIATGSFEIGALLALDGHWQKLEKLRILMGNEVTKRTKKALLAGVDALKRTLDLSIEREKEANDFLTGVPAIVDALGRRQIECRVYNKDKFHAKAYITHSKLSVVPSTALVGSSNFSFPGLTENVELNVQIRNEVDALQEWYERHWKEAEDITPEILKLIERHTFEYLPFDVYAKALQEYFRGHEMSAGEWELAEPEDGGSRIYPILAPYQREGYQAMMKIASKYKGALLCDGVGLGKTFIGLMLIERLIEHDRKRVALFVPKAARKPVWESVLDKYLSNISGAFANLEIFNHTDLNRGDNYQKRLESIRERADVIVIDEAHHFRNPGIKGEGERRPSRYRRMFEIAEGKTVFLLTATPINNRLDDLQHMMELFTHRQADYFKDAPLGIHSLPGHFRKMEKELERLVTGVKDGEVTTETNQAEAGQVLSNDALFRELVVQRSRAYVKSSEQQHGGTQTLFPTREAPKLAEYSVKKTYGRLLEMVDRAFAKTKPLFSLAIYNPLAYYKGPDENIDPLVKGRQNQVVSLIRTQFLKRFESSAHAFGLSCETLLGKLLAFVTKHSQSEREKNRLERWKAIHSERMGFIRGGQRGLFVEQLDLGDQPSEESFDDLISEELLEGVEELNPEEYNVDTILDETYLDLDQVVNFLDELKKFKPSNDDKLRALIKLLKSDSVLKKHKVLLFTEYMATARYLKEQLKQEGIEGIDEVDSTVKEDRGQIIRRFAPYYNGSSSAYLAEEGLAETRVLISTDVLSEGLNLQDATRLINYDLHWNPVRLMQRIGRVDRRMNQHIEEQLVSDHPDQKSIRATVAYWNFLPPDELDVLLALYSRVSHKTLRISRTFGIEGKKLLRPEDDFEALREFNHTYEGTKTATEEMHLEYQKLIQDDPGLTERLDTLPGRVFSGKAHPSPKSKAVFFCYALPAPGAANPGNGSADAAAWSEEKGFTQWYLYDLATEQVEEDASAIIGTIRSKPETPRQHIMGEETLSEIRKKIEKHIKNTYLRRVQAPQGVKPALKAWMEIS
jgi:superfamily II DNA or RNA helicase